MSVGQRIAALLRSHDQGIELVMVANGWAAIAVGGYAWFKLDAPGALALPLVAMVFVLLTVLLLYRATFWVSAALGSILVAASFALLGLAIGTGVFGETAWRWIATGAAALLGGAFAFGCYHRVAGIAEGDLGR